jgi:hypothetical protein
MSAADRMQRAAKKVRIYNALEQACREHVKAYASIMVYVTSDAGAVSYGGLTPRIAHIAGLPDAYVRRVLDAEVRDGLVLRWKPYPRTIAWWPVGLWDKLQAERVAVDQMTERLKAELADFAGKPVNVKDITERVDSFLAGLAMQSSVKVTGAKLTGDVLHVDVEMPRWMAIDAGLAPAIEFTVDIERAAQEGGAV